MKNETTATPGKRRIATVGTFDGLHRGHRRVIGTLKEEARERGLEAMIICFDRHPLETIAPERAPLLIQSPSERTNALFQEGLQILTLEFTPSLAALTAEEWLRLMHERHGVDALVVGYDNTFGSDGTAMSLHDYRELGRKTGIEIIEAPYEPHAASSAIRRLLGEGRLDEARQLLGRPFSISGEVVPGKRLGRQLGFPTANISPNYRALLPKKGVYAVEVSMPDGSFRRGVANIGTQPSVAQGAPMRLEVHIPGFDGDLYGERLTVKFVKQIRDEKRFDTLEELKAQIREDITNC